jgi:hypothetical protein
VALKQYYFQVKYLPLTGCSSFCCDADPHASPLNTEKADLVIGAQALLQLTADRG